ncbi:hypothetical protein PTSG_12054 [Salpingoeca rosetta]|uniref:Phytanoyl-CoA dioxygenase n=1 Tax=Salpingoeca rosetta (strain ATCC 50818 / BSB-021) TaxID=946362 RepID=F2U680_SALR5|nr:uncharacterized protein PTSG_12054 [Salpingoeca rosetta]EGD83021.1 hypothetical protein PTSG_12054 [Salpingoeca rosetta]|eukprot:XP_004995385.1 hypothetical protein PTSG_12054 [Salpingoeca rosetta]
MMRTGVRLALARCPSVSRRAATAANRLVTDPQVLQDKVDAWKGPYTPGPLTEAEFEQFFTDGFVLKRDILTPDLLHAAQGEVEKEVDEVARALFAAGKITDLCEKEGFFSRLTALEKQFPHVSVLLHKRGVLRPGVRQLWSAPVLLDIAQQIIGPDIAAHPVWNLRCKTPQQEQATVPWHQDIAYLDEECWSTLQLTAWVPLLDANEENGCMQVVRGGHRTGRAAHHTCCAGGTWYVDLPEEQIEDVLECNMATDVVTCPVPKGSVLLLNNLIPHRSLNNMSPNIRWSFDLRWQSPHEPTGFSGIKETLPMRMGGNKDFNINWDKWAREDRHTGMTEAAQRRSAAAGADGTRENTTSSDDEKEFDTTIVGPWMHRWPITHHNRHTRALMRSSNNT